MTFGIGLIVTEDDDNKGFWIHIGLIFVISIHIKK